MTPEIRFMLDVERCYKTSHSKDYGALTQALSRWLRIAVVFGGLAFALIAGLAAAGPPTLLHP